MKFSSPSTELQKILGSIGGVIPTKSTLPILENFLFQLSGNQLKITATDLDISMTIEIKVIGDEDGTVAIPAKRLFETIRSLPATNVEFSTSAGASKVSMKTNNGKYVLTGESYENYPTIPSFKTDEEFNIRNEVLHRLINKTSFAVSTDELRPAMMGMLFHISKDSICAVATDGHRLVRVTNSSFSSNNLKREIIIPAKALSLILKSVDDSSTKISLSENHVMFSFNDSVLITRIIEDKYPNYESVIPLDNNKKLVIDKNQLLASVKRISLYASSTTHQIRFSLSKNSITISAEDIDLGSEAQETLSCEYTAESMEIGFNSSYTVDVLSHMDTDEVVYLLSSPTRAAIVQPSTQRDNENLLMLVMPVRLNV